MNIEQYRQLRRTIEELNERLSEQERKYAAMCEVFGVLINRRAGRPTKAEVERLEELQARMHGATH